MPQEHRQLRSHGESEEAARFAHDLLSGNDAGAKDTARMLLESFGWSSIVDLGDIATARATESYLPLWMAIWKTLGTATFNIRVVR